MAKRYQRGNQKTGIKETHTIQWPKDTKEAIRRQESKKDIQYNGQKIPKRQSEDRNQRNTYNTMAKRYQRGNQKTGIKERHTIQWPKDTKEAIRRQESIMFTPKAFLIILLSNILALNVTYPVEVIPETC
jgi:hypothetical protein